jgi:hypothetical protein
MLLIEVSQLEGVAMFSRIRYAARVLSYSPPKVSKCDEPDIVFEEEYRPEISKLSRAIGTLIEVFVVSVTMGLVAFPLVHFLFPAKENASLATITGIAAAFLAALGSHIFERLNRIVRLNLKIGERIAPYFGHKITRVVHALRG